MVDDQLDQVPTIITKIIILAIKVIPNSSLCSKELLDLISVVPC